MTKRSFGFEWQTGEEDWQKEQAVGPATDSRQSQPLRAKHLSWWWRFAAVALLVCLLGGGGWLWRTAQSGLSTIQEELAAAVQVEFWAAAHERRQVATEMIDEQAKPAWQQYFEQEYAQLSTIIKMDPPNVQRIEDVQMVALQEEAALIQMVTKREGSEEAYRQSRFYRHSPAGWRRTTPVETLWGLPTRLESTYFVFNLRQRDAEAVAKVAPQVDMLYIALANNLGQPRSSQQEKLSIDVSVMYPSGLAHLSPTHPFHIPSPALYLAPNEVTADQLLLQSIALVLLNDMLGQTRVLPTWQPMLDGLRLWQLWDLQLPLSSWQDEVMAWTYRDDLSVKAGQGLVLPEWYPSLCAMYSLWMASPAQLQIPLLCGGATPSDWESILRYLHIPLTRLDQLGVPVVWPVERLDLPKVWPDSSQPGQVVALATLIEYAVEIYGRDRLPLFVAGLGQYDSWQTLVPAVFDVSSSEFEDGWRAYLATHAGVPRIR